MQISINKLSAPNIKPSYRKEDKFNQSYIIVAIDEKQQFRQPLDVRFYWTAQTCYCCLWGSLNGTWFNGCGKAGGYGYEKKSAAMEEALRSAGFNVKGLSATGMIEEAMHKIAALAGLTTYTIVNAHG